MYVRSKEPNYWKVETLDRFDGLRWERSGSGRGNNPLLPTPYNLAWKTELHVTIRDLDTNLFPIAGTALEIKGVDPVVLPSEDGTVEAVGESIDEGDSYTVEAYVPQPTPRTMRNAPPVVPNELLPYTEVGNLTPAYDRMATLASRLARGQRTAYDVVRSIQAHLRTEYGYNERPPERRFPLPAFLFRDRIGYCQHFSGAMALMLRMLGIPARVAAGFTPGSYNTDTKEYRVRDLDAHSWVEVWFEGIGWVPFDPTPSVSPAEAQSDVNAPSASGGPPDAGETPDTPAATSAPAADSVGAQGGAHSAGRVFEPWMAIAALTLLAAAALLALGLRSLVRRERRVDEDEAEIAWLRRVLVRSHAGTDPSMTLRQLELRLDGAVGSEAARYLRMLRDRRYGAHGGRLPDGAARRQLRRGLGVRATVSFRRG
jgi:transglutaminase-like putative cysteine protease